MSLKEFYKKEVIPKMKKEFGYTNDLEVPRFEKVVVNIGIGQSLKDPKFKEEAIKTLEKITGQKPIERKAKKSISGFKIRKGSVVGLSVTLRGQRMYDFIEKLIKVTLPRVRDFRGIPRSSFDPHGNLSIGFKEQIPFPEIKTTEMERIHGLQVTIVTNASSKKEAEKLFEFFGFPLS